MSRTNSTVTLLNGLLCNYKIYFHKLLNYQWLIQASNRPELNEELHEYAEEAEVSMDHLVQAIEELGGTPIGTWSRWQKQATIKFKIPVRGASNILDKVTADTQQLQQTAKILQQPMHQDPIRQLATELHQRLSERIQNLRALKAPVAAM